MSDWTSTGCVAVLLQLNHRVRTALILRYCNELSYDEIAKVTAQPQGTVKAHVFRGLRKLYRRLGEQQ